MNVYICANRSKQFISTKPFATNLQFNEYYLNINKLGDNIVSESLMYE